MFQKHTDTYARDKVSRPKEALDTTTKGRAALGPAARHAKALCLQATLCDRDDVGGL